MKAEKRLQKALDDCKVRIENLTEDDIGRFVIYDPGYKQERGRIKSWNDSGVFVVYHCNDDWDDYKNYTAAHTKPEDLVFEDKAFETIG